MKHNMHHAKDAKNDEFYTQLKDIEAEMQHYKHDFEGKVIYCNCDGPSSNFLKYFSDNFSSLKLKKLIVTGIGFKRTQTEHHIATSDIDGRYESDECQQLLKEADYVITNPPFSKFNHFIRMLDESTANYIIIGNYTALKNKYIFSQILLNKIHLGVSKRSMKFIQPNGTTKDINACWYTSMYNNKPNKVALPIGEPITERFDDYDAINVNSVKTIPKDYFGIMGVPMTYFERHNPEIYDLLDCETSLHVNGKCKYVRLIIRRVK